MNAGVFNVLHNSPDQDVLTVGYGVDVYFGAVFQKSIDQQPAFSTSSHRRCQVVRKFFPVVEHLHFPATEYVGRANEYGIPYPLGQFFCFFLRMGDTVFRLGNV